MNTEHPLSNKTIVLTGIRDSGINAYCETISGCKIGSSISSKVDFIVVPDLTYSNKKTVLADQLGITKYTIKDFKIKYIGSG